MKIFSVRGITQSGKTTTIERIIQELVRRGYTVASVKEIHYEKFEIDTPGSNTQRHRLAGSRLVSARGYKETDILFQEKLPISKLISFYNDEYDFLVMEGVSGGCVPEILTAHTTQELDEKWNPFVFAISGRISAEMEEYRGVPCIDATRDIERLVDLIERKTYRRLPLFPPECCAACGMTCRELAVAIIQGRAKREDCALDSAQVTLKVGGKEIPMVPFVQRILKNAVTGVVSELDGWRPGLKIEVSINGDQTEIQKE